MGTGGGGLNLAPSGFFYKINNVMGETKRKENKFGWNFTFKKILSKNHAPNINNYYDVHLHNMMSRY